MKRADLDILEQNVASKMPSELEDISQEVEKISGFSAKLETAKDDAKNIPFSPSKRPKQGHNCCNFGQSNYDCFSVQRCKSWSENLVLQGNIGPN
jgi:hypothetical protein